MTVKGEKVWYLTTNKGGGAEAERVVKNSLQLIDTNSIKNLDNN